MDNQIIELVYDTIAMRDDVDTSLTELQSHYTIESVEVWKNYIELYKFGQGVSFGNYNAIMLEIPVNAAGKPLPTDVYLQVLGVDSRRLLSAVICVHGESVGFQNIVSGEVRKRDGVWGPTVQASFTRLERVSNSV